MSWDPSLGLDVDLRFGRREGYGSRRDGRVHEILLYVKAHRPSHVSPELVTVLLQEVVEDLQPVDREPCHV